jgi:hypothetical protein
MCSLSKTFLARLTAAVFCSDDFWFGDLAVPISISTLHEGWRLLDFGSRFPPPIAAGFLF